jgi:HAD superfamily hydrolase (TIGR01490 family)
MSNGAGVVFADVDETLIRGKSILQFVRYADTFAAGEDVHELHEFVTALISQLQSGAPPEEANAAYYARILRGRAVADVGRAAAAWYAEERTAPRFLKQSALRVLRSAREKGAAIVLVSGSFRELVAPIAEVVGASDMLVTQLEESGGYYTGRLAGPPVIGEGKVKAVVAYAADKHLDLSACIGLGDDVTDVPFMRLLGTQYVPADAPADMIHVARTLGWRILEDDPQ